MVAVPLGEDVPLDEFVPVPLDVPVPLLEPDPVPLPVTLAGGVTLPLGVALAVALPVALPDGLRRLATLRPRYVSRATTSAGDSTPPAASHSSTDSRTPLAMMLLGTSWLTLANRKQGAGVAR